MLSSGFFLFYPLCQLVVAAGLQDVTKVNITAIVPEIREKEIIDTDSDGLPNDWEIIFNLDPLNPYDAALDPDQDRLNNLQEYIYNTNPRLFDTNEGGIDDFTQIREYRTTPYHQINDFKALLKDSDADLLPDWWEKLYQFNLYTSSDRQDLDGDGLPNDLEFELGTNPVREDTDRDNLWDGMEAFITNTNPLNRDSDWDNLIDGSEVVDHRTNPKEADSDNDGISDGDEILNQTDPLDSHSLINLPDIVITIDDQNIPKGNNYYQLLVSHSVSILVATDGQNLNYTLLNPIKGELHSTATNNNYEQTPRNDTFIPYILTYYLPQSESPLGQTYLNLNIQEPLTVLKDHQHLNLLSIRIYLNDLFYSEIGRILSLNTIYPVKGVSIKIGGEKVSKTDDFGKSNIIVPEGNYLIIFSKPKYSIFTSLEKGPVINPIIKLERVYNLNIIFIILSVIIMFVLIRNRYLRKRS